MKHPYPYLFCLLLALWLAPRPGHAQFDPNQPVLIRSMGGGPTALVVPPTPNNDNMVQAGARVDRLVIGGNGVDGLANQQWYLRPVTNQPGRYWIENRNSQQALRMSNTVYWDGTQSLRQPIEQQPKSTTDLNQHWKIQDVPPTDPDYPSYYIINASNDKYLVGLGPTGQGTTVEAANPILIDSRWKWYFPAVSIPKGPKFDGVFTLNNVNANQGFPNNSPKVAMQVYQKSLSPSARIEQGNDIGIGSQQWQLVGNSMPGPFAIYNRASGLVLQLYMGSMAAGAKLEQGQYLAGEVTQQWYLDEVTTPGAAASMYRISTGNGRSIQVEGQASIPGARMEIGDYIGINSQKWYITFFSQNRGTNAADAPAAAPALAVYPNPATDLVTVFCPGTTRQATLTVTTLEGKQLLRQPYTGTVDVKSLPAGLYVLTVRDGEQVFRQKFAKQ
ncbi:RICIN domain-containing protein [Hymenobacter edaphi]|uniref:Uncharacterized protein n=1 Tax=Hymenobacter edaphi TaxID=2211146 RepID=A0A328BT57_9BACT|nr:RICIN domain-containing protein [Hymenobacter edaphi]RAK68208.1 hypothetical protein DLM85_09245 [Hymenobacter edaphi]